MKGAYRHPIQHCNREGNTSKLFGHRNPMRGEKERFKIVDQEPKITKTVKLLAFSSSSVKTFTFRGFIF